MQSLPQQALLLFFLFVSAILTPGRLASTNLLACYLSEEYTYLWRTGEVAGHAARDAKPLNVLAPSGLVGGSKLPP